MRLLLVTQNTSARVQMHTCLRWHLQNTRRERRCLAGESELSLALEISYMAVKAHSKTTVLTRGRQKQNAQAEVTENVPPRYEMTTLLFRLRSYSRAKYTDIESSEEENVLAQLNAITKERPPLAQVNVSTRRYVFVRFTFLPLGMHCEGNEAVRRNH